MKSRLQTIKIKQAGATLITALMMLLAMTILGISAIKMSSIDILIAGNDQQRLMLMQETETDLINLTTPAKLIDPLIGERVNDVVAEFDENGVYIVPETRNQLSVEIITDMQKNYGCVGFSGKGVSMGPENNCRLYDFQVQARKANSGAREIRRRGAGKEIPNKCKNSYLCQ